jgi:hypothetical protein
MRGIRPFCCARPVGGHAVAAPPPSSELAALYSMEMHLLPQLGDPQHTALAGIKSGPHCTVRFRPGLPPLRVIGCGPGRPRDRACVRTTPESYCKFALLDSPAPWSSSTTKELVIEASRLARNGREWSTWIEFCGLVGICSRGRLVSINGARGGFYACWPDAPRLARHP